MISGRTALFVGPTLSGISGDFPISDDIIVFPPVQLGSIYKILSQQFSRIIIADGYFHQVPSVWHREILNALDYGIEVIGCSSMGALRAAELAMFGMQGHGCVFDWFHTGFLDGDDEVAVLHGSQHPYPNFSIPLVNVRFAAQSMTQSGLLTSGESAAITSRVKDQFYAERNTEWIQDLANFVPDASDSQKLHWKQLINSDQCDIKRIDLLSLLSLLQSSRDTKAEGVVAEPVPSNSELVEHPVVHPLLRKISYFDDFGFLFRDLAPANTQAVSVETALAQCPQPLLNSASKSASLNFLISYDLDIFKSALSSADQPLACSFEDFKTDFLAWIHCPTTRDLCGSMGLTAAEVDQLMLRFFSLGVLADSFVQAPCFEDYRSLITQFYPSLQIDSFIGSFPILPCLRCHCLGVEVALAFEAYAVDLIIERYGFSDDLLDSLARLYMTPEIQSFPPILRNRELFSVIGPQLMGNIGFNSQLSGFTLLQACNRTIF